ncbi:hypothetical protein GGF43_004243 [Coemansia sp. RSA 2618]|nr:hypothetical protein GGF43_004243 [Coemansia sp. RSA 2618]
MRNGVFKAEDKIKKFVVHRQAEVALLISRLLCGYNGSGSGCFMWLSSDVKAEHCRTLDDSLCNFALDPSVHIGNIHVEAKMDSFVSLLLYLGYLTIGANNALCIPNNCMRDMWETLRLKATFGTWDQIQQDIGQHRLISSLFDGSTQELCTDFQFALTQLPVSDNSCYTDATLLEMACRYIISKLTLARYTIIDRWPNLEYDHQFLAQPQFNRTWAVTLLPFGRYNQTMVVLFHFVPITQLDVGKFGLDGTKMVQLARQALDSISDNSVVQQFAHCDARLDLGVAFGCGNAVIRQRLWRRADSNQMDTSEHQVLQQKDGESVTEWEQRLNLADNQGRRDALGWITQSIDEEFRQQN